MVARVGEAGRREDRQGGRQEYYLLFDMVSNSNQRRPQPHAWLRVVAGQEEAGIELNIIL